MTRGAERQNGAGADTIRAQALEVAAGWSGPDAPASWRLTAALFEAVAAHDELLNRLAFLPPDHLPALLASAATCYLANRYRPGQFAAYFPQPGGPQPAFDDGFFPAAAAFFTARLDDIAGVCHRRRYQMNEVARCTQVALGIAATAVPPTDPVALVDLGTGTGLGLQLDRFGYRVGTRTCGAPAASLTLECQARGRHQPPLAELPPIAARVGIELHPVDLEDPAARAWIQACAPPEASALARLTAAMDLTRKHPEKIITGDAVDALAGALTSLGRRHHVIVVDAYLAVFLPPERRSLLADVMTQAGRSHPVTWLSLDPLVPLGPDADRSVQGLAIPASLVRDYQQHGVFAVLGARTFRGGASYGQILARAHPSGQWVEWISPDSDFQSPA
jgi:hypothetical protein